MQDWLGILAGAAIVLFLYFAFVRNKAPKESERKVSDFSQHEHSTHHVDD